MAGPARHRIHLVFVARVLRRGPAWPADGM